MAEEPKNPPEYIDYAHRALRTAKLAFGDGDWVGAINRAYYAIFYAANERVEMKTKWPKKATPQQRAATEALIRRLQQEYPRRILRAVLFGSVARGAFGDESDIDVLVLMDRLDTDTKWAMWGVAARVSLDFDVILDPHVYSRELWDSLCAQGRALCRNIEREGIELKLEPAPTITESASLQR